MSRSPVRKAPLSDPGPPLSPLPPPTQTMQGVGRLALPLLLALYLVLAILHMQFVPTGQTGYQNAPDEAAHVAYVRTVAAWRLPTQASSANDPQGYEWHQPPLYYFVAARFLPFGDRGVRVASLLCGALALLILYQAARLLVPDEPLVAIVATGIAALTPTHIAITSTVNNDPMLELWFSAALLMCIASLRSGWTMWRAGWLGVAIGAACLTKATGLLLFPLLLLFAALLWRGGEKPASILRGLLWSGAVIVAICGWWYLRNARLYGEFLPLKTFERAFAGTAQAKDFVERLGSWGAYFALLGQWTFQSFWAVFGSPKAAEKGIPLFLPESLYLFFWLITAGMVAGLTRLHFVRNKVFTSTQVHMIWLLFATLGLVSAAFFGFVLRYFQAQGRYLYPAMLPIAILGAMGWLALFPGKYRGYAGGALLVGLGAFTGLFLSIVAPV